MWIKRKHIGKYKRVYNKTIYRIVYVYCLVGIYCVREDVWEWGGGGVLLPDIIDIHDYIFAHNGDEPLKDYEYFL